MDKTYYSKQSSMNARIVEKLEDGTILVERYGCYSVLCRGIYRDVDMIFDDRQITEAVKEGK